MSTKSPEELLATVTKRHAIFAFLLKTENTVSKQTLTDNVDLSRPTVNKVCDKLCDNGLIESNPSGIVPTLLGRLIWIESEAFNQHLLSIIPNDGDGASLWISTTECHEVRRLIRSRLEILEYVETAPRDKRALVDNLDGSRSTVSRAVRELEMADLVTWISAGYTVTAVGQQVLNRYRITVRTVDDIRTTQAFLDALSHDYPIHPTLFANGSIERTNDSMPYHLPTDVYEQIRSAEHVRVYLPVLTTPQLLDCLHHGIIQNNLKLELLTSPSLLKTLTTDFPGSLAAMATNMNDSSTVCVTNTEFIDLPPFGLVLAEGNGSTTVSIIAYGDQNTIQGTIQNDTAAAIQWTVDWFSIIRDGAIEKGDELCELTSTEQPPMSAGLATAGDIERVAWESEGFVRLTSKYFTQRPPATPMTGWRTNFDLVDVHAGYAIDREVERDNTRHNLTTDLVDRLGENTNIAVLGPPGSGKSTVCKTVACRWYEQGIGSVFYRESGVGTTLDSPAVLREQISAATTEGHTLVVVEDAVRAEANTIFRVMQALQGNDDVTFLLDARTEEWDDHDAMPIDARLEAYRNEAIDTVSVPTFDDREYERLIRQFEQTTDFDIDSSTVQRLREYGATEVATQEQSQPSGGGDPGELLLFLHRLVLSADPLAVYGLKTPTTLVEDVKRTYEDLRQAGDLTLDVSVLVNLLNAAGIGVYPSLVCALADGDETSIDTIREELSSLHGRVIFARKNTPGEEMRPYRTVHETWSVKFLEHLLAATTEHAASQRFGRCVTALLSLADDKVKREQIRAAFEVSVPAIESIAASPDEWADATVEDLFGLGLRRRGLASLFGQTGDSCINLPEACSLATAVDCTFWRASMASQGGNLDRAEHEYESIADLATTVETTDPEWAATLRGRRLNGLGRVAWIRGEFDTAKTHFTRAINCYEKAGDKQRLAEARQNLGSVALVNGEPEAAKSSYQQCLEVFRELGVTRKEAHALSNLGAVVMRIGPLKVAVEHLQHALDQYNVVGDRLDKAVCFVNLGLIAARQGNLGTSETYCTQALDLAKEAGVSQNESYSLAHLALVNQIRGDFETAEEYYQRSLDIRREVGNKRLEARSRKDFGSLAQKRGKFDTAVRHCTVSREICEEIDDSIGEARNLLVLGTVACERDNFESAAEYGKKSLDICQESSHKRDIARCHRLLGRADSNRGRLASAENHLTQALSYFQETGHRYDEAKTLSVFGTLAQIREDHEEAREQFEAALAINRDIGAIRDSIAVLEQLVAICETMTDHDVAQEYRESATEIVQTTEFIEPSASLDQ